MDEEVYWKALRYGAKNKIKGGFKGVVMEALAHLLPLEGEQK